MERFHQGLFTAHDEMSAPVQSGPKSALVQQQITQAARAFEKQFQVAEMSKYKSSQSVGFDLSEQPRDVRGGTGRNSRQEGFTSAKPPQPQRPKPQPSQYELNPAKMAQKLSEERPSGRGSILPASVEERLRTLFAAEEGSGLHKMERSSNRTEEKRSTKHNEDKLLPSTSQNLRFTSEDVRENVHNRSDAKVDAPQPNTIPNTSREGKDKSEDMQLPTVSEQVSIVNRSVDKDSMNESKKSKNQTLPHQRNQQETIRESSNWNAQSRATAAFGSPQPDPYQLQPQSGLQISNSSKAESQRRTIENIDNDFSRENKFAAVEETSPLELPQMTESSVMRPSALPDEEDGILSREIFAALESFQKLTRDQPGFQAKLEQKLANKSAKEKSSTSSVNSSRKSSLPNWRTKKGETKHQTSTDSLPSMSKNSLPTGAISGTSFKKSKVLPPKEPTKPTNSSITRPMSTTRPAATDLLSYKSNVDALSDNTHEERSQTAKDKPAKPKTHSEVRTKPGPQTHPATPQPTATVQTQAPSSKKGTSGLVRIDSTGGRANKGPASSHPSSLFVSQSAADVSDHQPKHEPSRPQDNNNNNSSNNNNNKAQAQPTKRTERTQTTARTLLTTADRHTRLGSAGKRSNATGGRLSARSVGTARDSKSAVFKTEPNEESKEAARIAISTSALKHRGSKGTLFSSNKEGSVTRLGGSQRKVDKVEPLFSKNKNPTVVTAAPKAKIDTGLTTPRARPSSVAAASRLRMMTEVTKVVERTANPTSAQKSSATSGSGLFSEKQAKTALSSKLKALKTTQFAPLFK